MYLMYPARVTVLGFGHGVCVRKLEGLTGAFRRPTVLIWL